jgi:hypothetical protein
MQERTRAAMRDCTEMFTESGEHIATIGFNESYTFGRSWLYSTRRWSFLSKQGRRIRRLVRRIRSRNWNPAIAFTRWLRCLT